MILDTTDKAIYVSLGQAIDSFQPTFHASYVDIDMGADPAGFAPAANDGNTNGVTGVEIVAPPGGGTTQRQIKYINIYNADDIQHFVTIYQLDGLTPRTLYRVGLPSKKTLWWTAETGWVPGGVPGPQGNDGPQGEVGPIGMNWTGLWNSGTNYDVNDGVSYNGASFIAIQDGINKIPDSEPTYWELFAQKGSDGETGEDGLDGVDAGLRYEWNTNTANSDPGSGKVKVNNATPASITTLYISETDRNAASRALEVSYWDDSNSLVRGYLRIYDPTNPANFVALAVTGSITDNGGWDSLPVSYINHGGTLTNNMPVQIAFSRTGDAGATGPRGHNGLNYEWNTNTSNSDPTAGHLKANNSSLNFATVIWFSETDADGIGRANVLNPWGSSSSANKGILHIYDPANLANYALFNITSAYTDNGSWGAFGVSYLGHGGTLTNDMPVCVTVAQTGDAGSTGATGPRGQGAGVNYQWNTNTANSDPTSGKLKVNNATIGSATALYINETDADSLARSAYIGSWDDSTSAVKGVLHVYDPTNVGNYAMFQITSAYTDSGSWGAFSVTPIGTGGTLSNNLPVVVSFYRSGDKGDTGATGAGVPTGGTAGQVLAKVDGTDYNTQWVTGGGGGGGGITKYASAYLNSADLVMADSTFYDIVTDTEEYDVGNIHAAGIVTPGQDCILRITGMYWFSAWTANKWCAVEIWKRANGTGSYVSHKLVQQHAPMGDSAFQTVSDNWSIDVVSNSLDQWKVRMAQYCGVNRTLAKGANRTWVRWTCHPI